MNLSYDGSYWWIHADAVVDRTVQVRPDLAVDLSADGQVVGVECVSGSVHPRDLAVVLFALPFPCRTTSDRDDPHLHQETTP